MAKDEKNKKEKKHFFKDFKTELKKVIWPTSKQVANNTVAVITVVLITAIIVLVLDLAFKGMNKYGINKLKSIVGNETEQNVIQEDASIEENQNEAQEDTNNVNDNVATNEIVE